MKNLNRRATVALFALVAVAALLDWPAFNASQPARQAEAQRVASADRLETVTGDMCDAAVRFEHPRAKPGFTAVNRALPDGAWLVVVPFTVGKVERQARCVGRADGSFEFAVERA